jgi:hypothetical protein
MGEPPSTITRTTVRQYSPVTVLTVRAVAAVPMGLLAWVVAPAVAGAGATRQHFVVALMGLDRLRGATATAACPAAPIWAIRSRIGREQPRWLASAWAAAMPSSCGTPRPPTPGSVRVSRTPTVTGAAIAP